MGRRYKGPIPQEMLDDKGIPGKLYFEKPKVVEINVVRSGNATMTVDLNSFQGPCRLKSTLDKYDFIFKDKPHEIKYHASLRPKGNEIEEYLRQAEIHGYGKGSIVARRWCNDWRWTNTSEWGLILDVNRYLIHNDNVWNPFSIRWFCMGQENSREPAWAEDLYVIHACLSEELLGELIEEQSDHHAKDLS